MLITRIDASKSKRYKVFSDYNYLFPLYAKELKQYHIEEGVEIADSAISTILDNIVYKRAKERALFLLERKSYSKSMMRDKLVATDYPDNVVDHVISFLEDYHYLNDGEYIQSYVNFNIHKKSKRQMTFELLQKGISKEQIEEFFYETDYTEEVCLERQFLRYIKGKDLTDARVKQKIFRYFYGKGFSISLIEDMMHTYI